MKELRSTVPKLEGVLAGSDEPVFRVLPQRVLEDMKRTNSESALVWNLIYPRAQPTLGMAQLLSLPPLWGSKLEAVADNLVPFYWGYNQTGDRLPGLDQVLNSIDGPGPQTEVDLFLLGDRELVLIEAKHMAGLGRCARYGSDRCPEVHPNTSEETCRYWETEGSLFSSSIDFGPRPDSEKSSPPCNRHYQLGRTVLVGNALARRQNRRLNLWLVIPRKRWGAIARDWIDFTDRLKDNQLWQRLRVLAWEDIAVLDK